MMSFQPSINIMYDIGKIELFESFVPNINQLEIIDCVLNDALNSEQHAHLLVGPYGAGKSLVGTMIATIMTNTNIDKKTYNQFFKSVFKVDQDLELSIREAITRNRKKWIPVTITGRSGNFEQIILNSIQKSLTDKEISFTLKNDASYIMNLLERWEGQHPEMLSNLEKVLARHDVNIAIFRKSLAEGEEQAIHLFKNLYSEIAFGMSYHNPSKMNFSEQLEYVFNLLERQNIGVFIVFDEFGRFLQTVANSKIYETMQQIQDLAELVNRKSNAFVLMITHTGLQQYSNENTAFTKAELERVEKRFFEHRLESDSSIFYRAAHKLLKKTEKQQADIFLTEELESLRYSILRYELFPDMTAEEINGLILEGCHPIHPLAIQMLPSMSNLLGQNDRTLYLFLNKFKVKDYLETGYFADQLFDYFYPDQSALLTLESMKYYRLAINYKVSDTAIRLVKLATLLNLINRFKLTEDFIQFALGINETTIKSVIKELKAVKLLRFNPFVDSYELYEGAIVVFEELYKRVETQVLLNDEKRIGSIQEIYGDKYHLPLGYNTVKSMTRYIETEFVFAQKEMELVSTGDGTLLYILARNIKEAKEMEKLVQNYEGNNVLFGVVELEMKELLENTNKHVLLKAMLKMPELLNAHENLEQEIMIRLDTVGFRIQKLLQPLKEFNSEIVRFYMNGEEIPLTSPAVFSEFIDRWMMERFPSTPEIRNENFNKRNAMKIQRKAAMDLLNQIMHPQFTGEFEITGNGPDYLIAATTFKNLNFNFKYLDQQPTPQLQLLRECLVAHIEASDRNSIYSLFSVALSEPFGIREPVVPLLVIALIRDKWHQMAFYSHDLSLTQITAEMLYEILEQEVHFYEYEIYQLSEEKQVLLQTINHQFFDDNNPIHPNALFKMLNQWLLRLPRFTQVTAKQRDQIQTFKQIIRASETDPLLASEKLLMMGLSGIDLAGIKAELDGFVKAFKKQIHLETLNLFKAKAVYDISKVQKKAIQNSPQLKEIVVLYESSADIDAVILKVVGIRLEDWSDVTYDSYFTTLTQYLKASSASEEIRLIDGDQVLMTIQEVDLSVKGKTIYNQLRRIVSAGGKTMNPEEVKYILYRILEEV
ncbi:hypothetical protein Q8G28_13520 [Lysinibacillus capsici]|uniref:hypothetical protein n=1 Tax=Lysinibacillus capsici TaxID=2115968 RepID=UPI0027310632|nr:hypothetical protein [Lysinibacillus capsici]MDP1394446.1 hypothetical protein [Lysinibacillus capsici]MDP1414884.1 hypothetical protein [Lysinibacillus capsici]MDP1430778.1 hypothetical protein [Lysinibacillus capsici]